MKQTESLKFTEGNLMRHITVMSLTSSFGIMAIYLVDLCDIFFISLLGEKQMAAAAGFASTLMFFISAINIGISVAAGSLISAAMGKDDMKSARELATTAAIIAVAVGAVLPGLTLWNVEYLLSLIGATGEVADMAASYLWIVLPASFLSGISMVAVSSLRADGQAHWSMYPSLAGAVVNLVLDPILIFGLGFGLEGAAMATVCARIATLCVALYATQSRSNLFARPEASYITRDMRELLSFTFPAVFSTLAGPVGMAILTRYMAKFGPEAIAGVAVVGRLYPVVFSVVNALSGSIGPIIGQNFGAGQYGRVRRAYFDALKFLAIYVCCAAIILLLLRSHIADAFSLTGLARDLLYLFCGPLAIVAFFNGSLFVSNALFMNVGKPKYPVWISWGRSTLGILPFVAVGSHFFGAQGVFIGTTMGGMVFSAIAITLSIKTMDQMDLTQVEMSEVDEDYYTLKAESQSSNWQG